MTIVVSYWKEPDTGLWAYNQNGVTCEGFATHVEAIEHARAARNGGQWM